MNRYKIPCTEAQTKKALELGAPIKATFLDIPNKCEYEGCYVEIPTAEEMLGWLEEQGLKISLLYDYEFHGKWDYDSDYKGKQMPCTSMGEFDTRKSATLDAINEALKYLETHKQ